jgi:hypothetical protein
MKPILFSSRKISSIVLLLLSLLISITLGSWNVGELLDAGSPIPTLTTMP